MNRPTDVIVTLLAFSFISCELPQNPRNADNAGIVKETITAIPDTVPVNSVYPCTLLIRYPEFIDSFAVFKCVNSDETDKIAGGAVGDDTVFVFSVYLPEPASYVITLLIYKEDSIDSLVATAFIFSTTPVVAASQSRIETMVENSAEVQFDVSDPDSNLLDYILTSDNSTPDTQQFRASQRAAATIRKELPVSFLSALQVTQVRYSVVVTDEDNQQSAAALCTLVYSPIKLTYAAGGLLISGLAWLWTAGDTGVAGPIFTASLRGDYVVTPAHLEGRRPLEFVGR